jgi:hypothetical protein
VSNKPSSVEPVDITDFLLPIEVWDAIDGEPANLVALLRGEGPIGRLTRDALAEYFEGTLETPKKKRGQPPRSRWAIPFATGGHDRNDPVGFAAIIYEIRWRYIKKRGWNLKSSGKLYISSDRVKDLIAERHNIDAEAFRNYLRRSKKERLKLPKSETLADFWAAHRADRVWEKSRKSRADK